MNLTPEMQDTINQLSPNYIKYASNMEKYPLYLPFQDSKGSGHIVHGGVDNYNSMQDQAPDKVMIRRHHPLPNEYMDHETEEFPFWQRSYAGHLGTIIHGHEPMESHDARGNPHVISLDGGGAFGSLVPWGGKHRAIRLGDRAIFETPGSQEAETNYRRIKGY